MSDAVTREELIEAGARAIFGAPEEGPSLEAEQMREGCRSLAEDIIEVVEPLIRADERERILEYAKTVESPLVDLRAKIVALPGGAAVRRQFVLDLIDGASHV